jgi:hypothetical protein
MASVLQPWVEKLTFMQQSVLLTAIRGADGLEKRHPSKYVLRWLRRCILYSAFDAAVIEDPYDPRGGNFTGPIPEKYKSTIALFDEYFDSHDEVPHHFHMHLVHASEVLAYKHPNKDIARNWEWFYKKAARDLHMHLETAQEMDYRLGDSQGQWQKVGGEVLDIRREK